MLVVDASALAELALETPSAPRLRELMDRYGESLAPELIDAEVLGVIRRDLFAGSIDSTRADSAVATLRQWPGERVPHQPLVARAWDLRAYVRTWDAFYVALAEALGAPLLTLDERLARADGPRCSFISL